MVRVGALSTFPKGDRGCQSGGGFFAICARPRMIDNLWLTASYQMSDIGTLNGP